MGKTPVAPCHILYIEPKGRVFNLRTEIKLQRPLQMRHDVDCATGGLQVVVDLNLHGYLVFHLFPVADGAHLAVVTGVQRLERLDSLMQRLATECAKALVDKQSIYCQLLTDVT